MKRIAHFRGKKVNCPPSPFRRPDAADSRSFQDIICLNLCTLHRPDSLFPLRHAGEALAHASDRGYVLLLPTGHYIVGGAIAVAASFLALVLLPPGSLGRLASARLPLFRLPAGARPFVSLASFAALLVLVAAGLFGSRDPLSNPLPLTVWTLLWVGLTLVQGVLGNLWAWINPWYGPAWLARRLGLSTPMLRLPPSVGCWPAVILFAGFAWFELIDPAPDDPSRLAAIVLAYTAANLAAVLVFGYRDWTRRGEFLSVFFGMISAFAILRRERVERASRPRAQPRPARRGTCGREPAPLAAYCSCCWHCRRCRSTVCPAPSSGSD